MGRYISILILIICCHSCVSKKEYNALVIEKEKVENKTLKLEQKLKSLQIYQQHLKDSLNKIL